VHEGQRSLRFALVVGLPTSGAAVVDWPDKPGGAGISERRKQRTGSKNPFAALKLDQRNSVRVSSGVRPATGRNGGGFVAEARGLKTRAYRRSKAGDTVAVLTVESPTAPWPILERQFPNRAKVRPWATCTFLNEDCAR
jgi:hypothetical protein